MIEGVKNACTKLGEYGSQACTKISELGGRAISTIVETGSSIASKVKAFAETTLLPTLKKLGESLATFGRSIANSVKANPKEFAVIAILVGAVSALVAGIVGFGISKATASAKKDPANEGTNPPPAGDPASAAANNAPIQGAPTQGTTTATVTASTTANGENVTVTETVTL